MSNKRTRRPSSAPVKVEVSESQVETWSEEDEAEASSEIPAEKSPEEKYTEFQLRVVRSSMDLSLHTLQPSIFESSYINRSPSYQRRNRWDVKKRSQLIESLLMNIPIPPIFLFENEYNKYEVMDGRQRIDSIVDFLANKFALRGLEFWTELDKSRFSDLSPTLQRGLLRRTITAIVLLAETKDLAASSEIDIRMVLFRRLNTGGVKLNAQELRNALYPGAFNDMLVRASRNEAFTRLWGIPGDAQRSTKSLEKNPLYKSMFDCELVLRFFAIRETIVLDLRGSLRTLLDRCMARHINDTDVVAAEAEQEFLACLLKLDAVFPENPFKLPEGRLSRPLYDALMVALSLNRSRIGSINEGAARRRLAKAISTSKQYEVLIGRGNTIDAIKDRVDLAQQILFGE